MNSKSLRQRLSGLYPRLLTGFIAIIVIVMAMAYVVLKEYAYQSVYKQNQQELLKKVQFIAAREHATRDLSTLRRYQALLNAEIILVDKDYEAEKLHTRSTTLLDETDAEKTELQYQEIISQIDRSAIDRIFEGNAVCGVADVSFLTDNIVYAGMRLLDDNGEVAGALILIQQVKNIEAGMTNLFTSLSGIIVVSVAVACILAAVYVHTIIKPMRRLSAAAQAMAAGDYSVRVPVKPNDEIGQLAENVNELAEQLGHVICTLNNEKSKIEKIIFTIVEGIVAFDDAGSVFRCNPAALEMLEICSWEKCNGPDACERKQQVVDLLQLCIRSGKTERNTWVNPSGRTILAVASPIVNDERQPVGSVCLLRDVSEEQRLEQLRREYIANVSHELRTPLTGIRGMAETLMDDVLETEEEKKQSVHIIYKETLRLQKLIGEMLELSRMQDGNSRLELEPVEIGVALERAAYSMRGLAEEAGIAMTVTVPPGLVAQGNENRIVQTLVSLIDNAISFTPAGGSVEIIAREVDEKAFISVRDSGAGIEPQHLPYIWERFYKADKLRLRTKGTGLGLTLAKRAVELMNGEISVQTELGKGTEFTITLQKIKKDCCTYISIRK